MESKKYSKRFEAVFLTSHPKGPQMTKAEAARYLNKPRSFVQRWTDQWKMEKNVDDQPNAKPRIATTPSQDNKIATFFDKNPGVSLRKGTEILHNKGIEASTTTIKRRLNENDVKYRSTQKKPLL